MQPALRQFVASRSTAAGLRGARPRVRPWLLAWFLLPAILPWNVLARASGQGQPPALPKARLDMVFSDSLFRSVNRNDAVAAIRVWGRILAQERGFDTDPTVEILGDLAEIRKRVQANAVGVLSLDVLEYLQLADLPGVEPAFAGVRDEGGNTQEYLMLVRGESGTSSLEALRGKRALIHANTGANLGLMWLNAMLHDAHLGLPERFFSSVEVVDKPSAAILPVFFGKADLAIVDGSGFAVMKELNPQLGKRLLVLNSSPRMFEGMICLCKGAEARQALREGMRDLHLSVQGRQVLRVFRYTRLMPVDKLALDRVRELWQKTLSLSGPPEPALRPIPAGEDRRVTRSGGAQ